MKFVFASFALLLASAASSADLQPTPVTPSAAQPAAAAVLPSAERVALARRYMAVSAPPETMMDGVRAGFWQAATEQLTQIEDDQDREAAKARANQVLEKLEPKLASLMPGLLEAYAQVYAREFSAEELQQLIAFAETPAGKHYLARVDMLDMDPSLAQAQQELMMGVAPVLDDFRKQMCAEKAAMRVAAGDKKATCPLSRDPAVEAG